MQAVSHFDEHHTNVVAHGKQQFAEIFRLRRSVRPENAAGNLGKSIHNLSNFFAKHRLDVFGGVLRVFHHIVKQRSTNGGRAQPNLLTHNPSHRDGVQNVGLAGAAANTFMGFTSKLKSLVDDFHFFAVIARQIAVQQVLISLLYQFIFFFRGHFILRCHIFPNNFNHKLTNYLRNNHTFRPLFFY